MSTDESLQGSTAEPSPEILAQAAAWIASLHDEERTEKLEMGFRRWLAADARHRAAFEMANEIWVDTECWPKPESSRVARPWGANAARQLRWKLSLVTAAVAAILVGALLYFRAAPVATTLGEQRNLVLEDGTRVMLNTDTRIRIEYDRKARRIGVESGEALFEVARRPGWPFVVTAGDQQITALGTAFVVRRDGRAVSVTLMEGRVQVAPTALSTESGSAEEKVAVLSAGQRLTFVQGRRPVLDRPVVATAVAWRRGQVVFDHTPLAEAIDEMNRYSPLKLELANAAAGQFLITGVFRAGDSESFAQAVAESYRMEARTSESQVVLSGGTDPR